MEPCPRSNVSMIRLDRCTPAVANGAILVARRARRGGYPRARAWKPKETKEDAEMTTSTKTWTEKFVDLSHGKTRYWEAGTGYPTILIHGAGWNSGCESWALNIGPLAEKLHVYAID